MINTDINMNKENVTKDHRSTGKKAMKITIGILLFLVIVIGLLLVFLGNYRRNYCSGECPEWMRKAYYAHRGIHASENVDENSLGAFKLAVEMGYAIEMDLRYTKDMVPMVSHDNNMLRMCGKDVNLSNIDYKDVKELTFIESGEKILSFEEFLSYIDGKVPLLIELKAYHIPGKFEENVMKILSSYKGQYAIQSYNPLALSYVKKIDPNVTIGLLYDDVPGLPHYRRARILKDNLFGMICHPAFITYNAELITEHELDLFRNDKNLVFGFTFDEKDISTKSYSDTFDSIVFERR